MMDFLQRIKQHSRRIMRMKSSAMAPTASVRKEIRAGAWSDAEPLERLARLCNAVLDNFENERVLWAEFDGGKGLDFIKNPALWIGPGGGKTWSRFFTRPIDPSEIKSMLSKSPSCVDDVHSNGLEVLDMTELQVCDWKGALVYPQVARLVLVSPIWRPTDSGKSEQYFGLVLDFDQRLLDAGRAVGFLDGVASKLLVEEDV